MLAHPLPDLWGVALNPAKDRRRVDLDTTLLHHFGEIAIADPVLAVPAHAQQFLAIYTPIHNHFQLRRHRLSASEYRVARDRAFATWRDATGTALVG